MKHGFKSMALGAALAIAASTLPSLVPASFAAQDDHDRDRAQQVQQDQYQQYYNNTYYRTGNQEGYQDYQRHTRRKSHHHKYRSDDDRRAHDAGYEQGWQGHQYTPRDHDDDHRPQ